MKTTIYARVVAKAIKFSDDIEMHYICLDEKDNPTGTVYGPVHFAWEDVKQRFWIDMNYAQLCEGYFREGDSAFLGNRQVTIDPSE